MCSKENVLTKNAARGLIFIGVSGRRSEGWGISSFRSSTLISLCPSSRTGVNSATGGSFSSSSSICRAFACQPT